MSDLIDVLLSHIGSGGAPVRWDSIFRIASVTKPVTEGNTIWPGPAVWSG